MTGRETHHVHLSRQLRRQGGSDPGLQVCQSTCIVQQAAERAFSRCVEAGTGSAILTPGAAAGFIGRHGISPA